MNKLFFIAFFLLSFCGYSQEDAWVYFKDKPNAQFYFDNPLQMLSQRSLDRRTNQNIALDSKDVPIHQPYVDQIIAASGIEVKAKSKWFNAVHVRGAINDIQNLASLSFVDHIYFADRSLNTSGKMKKSSKISGINAVNKVLETTTIFDYGNSTNQIQMLNANLLHQQNFTGSGKIIAVMDAGFPSVDVAPPFQRLRDNNQILGGYNFVDRNSDFYTRNSHGTLVLSTMGGFQASQLVGTAPDANYYLFITEDADTENPIEESNWVEAAEMADSLGVDIITTSLGYFDYDNPNYSYTYSDMNGTTSFISKGADIAFSRGMICVASAGNSGSSPLNPHIAVPADAINVLAIGAVKSDEVYASFSSIGPSFDGRIKPDVMAQGQSAVVATVAGTVGTASGTSFSGPIMAGAIASFWQAVPNLTNQQVVDFVKQSADRYANPTNQYGYGIPDFQSALNSVQLSINDSTKGRFLVYPNPVSDKLFISFPTAFIEANISFYNVMGQIVFQKTIQNTDTTLSMTNLNSGIYFYKIYSNSFVQTGKIIRN
ncbi:S8 family serine peptidase [Flavobacterium paronense]|uniref:S8 family serine peptidase n=1 Tax=Flavobacterium paronense TaxID=1392775 RepID=A0ABV5GH73_9FLAO|nr:S8 family serine peptidase [Flavobacterium paronense]MDN3676539.1 S8 family serine peptidase [Flavobacterium paronense]